MAEHSVAEPANMSERCVALVSQLFQSQHGTIPTVCEWGLEKLENLQRQQFFLSTKYDFKPVHELSQRLKAYLFKNILLSHEFLSFPVGFVDHDLQNILPTVGDIYYKEN